MVTEQASPLLLTVPEAARRLSLARSTLYELVLTRQIESVKIGRSRRIPLDALVAYVDRLRREQGLDRDTA
ncbi:MAG: helix-turn-helix domain-containing protein [Chloroflexi bacterium]|nr:helix-turn-helix domain-containing protein [Chloroflexota bacterium]